VLDEAYANFLPQPVSTAAVSTAAESAVTVNLPNLLVLRSLTKDYALAGLRLGYLTGDASLIERVRRARQAWNVNALAQAAGVFVLEQRDWLRRTMTRLHADKTALVGRLRGLGYAPLPSAVHYFLLPVGDAPDFRRRLLAESIQVRDASSFGLPDCVRIATRGAHDNERLCEAIAAL
jgi:histidinol-phosphate/aromatic aminotransferase/cobyric acid decarboxylase-like protein